MSTEQAQRTKEQIQAALKLERWRAKWTSGRSLRQCNVTIAKLETELSAAKKSTEPARKVVRGS